MPGIKDDDDHTDESFDGSVYGNPDTNLTDDEKEFLKANGCSSSKNDNNAALIP